MPTKIQKITRGSVMVITAEFAGFNDSLASDLADFLQEAVERHPQRRFDVLPIQYDARFGHLKQVALVSMGEDRSIPPRKTYVPPLLKADHEAEESWNRSL